MKNLLKILILPSVFSIATATSCVTISENNKNNSEYCEINFIKGDLDVTFVGQTNFLIKNGKKFSSIELPEVYYRNWIFEGWAYDDNGTEQKIVEDFVINKNLEIYPLFIDPQASVKIKFKIESPTGYTGTLTGDTTVNIYKVLKFSEIYKPSASWTSTTENSMYFNGWFYDDGTRVKDTDLFGKETTVYAKGITSDVENLQAISFSKTTTETLYGNNKVYVENGTLFKDINKPVIYEDNTTFDYWVNDSQEKIEDDWICQTSTLYAKHSKNKFQESDKVYCWFDDKQQFGWINKGLYNDGDSIEIECEDGSFLNYAKKEFNLKIHIGGKLTEIGEGFLYGWESFNQNLEIPSTITKIGDNFMCNCYSMCSDLTINSYGYSDIGYFNCLTVDNYTNGNYNNGINVIGYYSEDFKEKFENLHGVKDLYWRNIRTTNPLLTVNNSGTTYYCYNFYESNLCGENEFGYVKLYDIYGSSTTILKETFNLKITFNSKLTSIPSYFLAGFKSYNCQITFPDSIKFIGSNFLRDCISFTNNSKSFSLPNNLAYVGDYFMQNCTALSVDVTVPNSPNLTENSIGGGFLYNTNITVNVTLSTSGEKVRFYIESGFGWCYINSKWLLNTSSLIINCNPTCFKTSIYTLRSVKSYDYLTTGGRLCYINIKGTYKSEFVKRFTAIKDTKNSAYYRYLVASTN